MIVKKKAAKKKRKERPMTTNLPLIKEVRILNTATETADIYPLVVRQVSKVSGKSVGSAEYQDLIAESLLAVVQTHRRFRPGSGVKFTTFAFPRIRGAAQDLIRKELTYTKFYEPTDVITLADSVGSSQMEEDTFSRLTFLRAIKLMETTLHPTLSLVLVRSFLEERKDGEIAEEIGVSRFRVGELREEALRNLRRHLRLKGIDAPGIDHNGEAT